MSTLSSVNLDVISTGISAEIKTAIAIPAMPRTASGDRTIRGLTNI
jgi:hypothetical protein